MPTSKTKLFNILPVISMIAILLASSSPVYAHHLNVRQYWAASNNARNTVLGLVPNPSNNLGDDLIAGSIYSPSHEHKIGYMVYLPPNYDPDGAPYPVIYVLHGIQGNELSYFNGTDSYSSSSALYSQTNLISLIAEAHETENPRDTILVFVNGGKKSFYIDYDGVVDTNGEDHHSSAIPAVYPGGVGDPFPADWPTGTPDFRLLPRTLIIDELIPEIDSLYNTIPNRTGRSIEGFSMGGAGAWRLALQHPDMFCASVGYATAGLDTISATHNPPYGGPLIPRDAASQISVNNISSIISNDLRLRAVTGASDSSAWHNNAVAVKDVLIANGLPEENIVIGDRPAGVGHKMVDLNTAAGEDGFNFHWDCFNDNSQTGAYPVANFSATPETGYSPLVVNFDGTLSTDSDGTIESYVWDFGDGGSAVGSTSEYTYLNEGTYTVKLTVTDNSGNTHFNTSTITVNSSGPAAIFTSDLSSGIAPLTVIFDATNSTDPNGTIESYAWDFGDGGSALGSEPHYTFMDIGEFTVSLTVTDNDGLTDTTTAIIKVLDPNVPTGPDDYLTYWDFDSVFGTVVTNLTENTQYDGVLTNGATANQLSKFGYGLSLDGSDDRMVVSNPLPTTSNVFSVSMWVKSDSSSKNMLIAGFHEPSANKFFTLSYLAQGSGTDCLGFTINNRDCFGVNTDTQSIDLVSDYNHVVAVFKSNDTTNSKIYVNGVSYSPSLVRGTAILNAPLGANLNLGNRGDTNNNMSFDGNMDDVKVFDYELTQEQVTELYELAPSYLSATSKQTDQLSFRDKINSAVTNIYAYFARMI